MNILIDTQIFIRLFGFFTLLSANLKALLQDKKNTIHFSSVSAWEIAIKHGSGKLKLPAPPEIFIPDRLNKAGFLWLEIKHEHTLIVGKLSPFHKDPFDRLSIAQANIENLTLLSADKIFSQYAVKLINANTF